MRCVVRPAGPRDIARLSALIRGLADYERLPPPNPAAIRRLGAALRGSDPRLHALLAFIDGRPVGYALYFYAFSSFLARPTLWLEDLFVLPEFRRHRIGRKLFDTCVRIGRRRGCGRMEWAVLDWNAPAHRFYRKTSARVLKEWMVYRLKLRRDAF